MLFKEDIEKAFGVKTYLSQDMENAIKLWEQMESGKPPWIDKDIHTIRFSNTIARELSKLVTQNIDIKVQKKYGDGKTAAKIQKFIDNFFLQNAQEIIGNQLMLGGIMAKWNGNGIDYIPPDRFLITEFDSSKEIHGAIFFSFYQADKKFYTKAEYHRFENEIRRNKIVKIYCISNKAFVSDRQGEIGKEISLKNTKWTDIVPEFAIENLIRPLFIYIRNPYSNTIDPDSPLGVSCFSECIEELRWLDIAMSTMGTETETSAPMMMVGQSAMQFADTHGIKLPKFIFSTGLNDLKNENPVEQWQPQLQIKNRIEGINFYLNLLAIKTGFSEGYFSFNEKQGMVTATQVEADERRTINTMMMYRQILDRPNSNGDGRVGAIHDIAYIINAALVIDGDIALSEYENYKLFCQFDDPFLNKQEDAMTDLQLANQGYMPKWLYLVKHRGYTEEEAKKIVEEARKESEAGQAISLFDEE